MNKLICKRIEESIWLKQRLLKDNELLETVSTLVDEMAVRLFCVEMEGRHLMHYISQEKLSGVFKWKESRGRQ